MEHREIYTKACQVFWDKKKSNRDKKGKNKIILFVTIKNIYMETVSDLFENYAF